MNLSEPGRHLVTADPDLTSYLPIDDEEWDLGVSNTAPCSLQILNYPFITDLWSRKGIHSPFRNQPSARQVRPFRPSSAPPQPSTSPSKGQNKRHDAN